MRHSVENNLSLLSLLRPKLLLPQHRYDVFLTDAEHAWAADLWPAQEISGPAHAGNPRRVGGTKNLALRRWPLDHYLELVHRLRETRPELAILFFGGPDEQDDHEKIQRAAGGGSLFFPKTKNLRQAAALIKKCDAFLSVDTVLMHVAAAMNVRGQVVIETRRGTSPSSLTATRLYW